jgi:hypothetical protein
MMFEDWCDLKGEQSLPAIPLVVAKFVADIAPLGIEKVWEAVCEISRAHYLIGLSDPTRGGHVAAAVNKISKIEPPQSWPEEHKADFLRLPYDLQVFLIDREKDQTRVVKQAMQEAADARKEAGLPKLPKNHYRKANDGDQPNPTA